jgi:hypothetical protein
VKGVLGEVQDSALEVLGRRVYGCWCKINLLGFRVKGLYVRLMGLEFMISDSGCRVHLWGFAAGCPG